MEGQSYGVPMVTYSRLCAVELPTGQDLTDYWRSPDSYFLIQGKGVLRCISSSPLSCALAVAAQVRAGWAASPVIRPGWVSLSFALDVAIKAPSGCARALYALSRRVC